MISQLNPSLPVLVLPGAPTRPNQNWPGGKGRCFALIDYSCEEFTLFKVAMDADGAIWDVPQSHVRFQTNVSMGRAPAGETDGRSPT